MCGICGIYGNIEKRYIHKMTETLYHRGPDEDGYYQDKNISLGMRRLKIIDLETGHQPIFNENKSICIIMNGEIYNFPALKKQLQKKGHRFYTKTDSEVIPHLYEEYGENFIHLLNGMFTIALWDKRKKKLFLIRDRIGIKPLYYTILNKGIIFGSELKCIISHPKISKKIDIDALADFLTFQYVPAPNTIFKHIKKLKPGHYLRINSDSIKEIKYWEIEFQNDFSLNENEIIEELEFLIKDAVKKRLISDVPLGTFLSGGLDSSLVSAMMHRLSNEKIKTFTIGFEGFEHYDERPFAKQVANLVNSEHHEFLVSSDMIPMMEDIVWYLDEPIADPAALPTYLISKLAREYVVVALTGEGGDENFAGYPRYILSLFANRLHHTEILDTPFINKISRHLPYYPRRLLTSRKDDIERNIDWVSGFNPREVKYLLKENFSHNIYDRRRIYEEKDALSSLVKTDLKTWLVDDILMKVDRMSMAHSLEARVPLLDHRIVEFIAKVPSHLKIKGFNTKYILKKIAEKYLPKNIIYRKKHAFLLPLKFWFKKNAILTQMKNENIISNYLSQEMILQTINNFEKRKENPKKIWTLLILEYWLRKFGDK